MENGKKKRENNVRKYKKRAKETGKCTHYKGIK